MVTNKQTLKLKQGYIFYWKTLPSSHKPCKWTWHYEISKKSKVHDAPLVSLHPFRSYISFAKIPSQTAQSSWFQQNPTVLSSSTPKALAASLLATTVLKVPPPPPQQVQLILCKSDKMHPSTTRLKPHKDALMHLQQKQVDIREVFK